MVLAPARAGRQTITQVVLLLTHTTVPHLDACRKEAYMSPEDRNSGNRTQAEISRAGQPPTASSVRQEEFHMKRGQQKHEGSWRERRRCRDGVTNGDLSDVAMNAQVNTPMYAHSAHSLSAPRMPGSERVSRSCESALAYGCTPVRESAVLMGMRSLNALDRRSLGLTWKKPVSRATTTSTARRVSSISILISAS